MTDVIFVLGTILLLVTVVLVVLVPQVKEWARLQLSSDDKKVYLVTLFLSLIAMCGSLWYSEIIGHEPCKLCWYQRIFMYPIVLISLIAYAYRHAFMRMYLLALSLGGFLIALYHIIQQRLPESGLSCGTVGQGVACDSLSVNAFNVITIPTMSAIIFMSIITVILLSKRQ